MFLDEIVNNYIFEKKDCECKAILNRNDIIGWLKTIGGFSNAHGGFFFIGVEDKTNKLIGFNRIDADKERNYFNNIINEHIFPRPNIDIDFISYKINDIERYIILVNVKESSIKPVVCKYDGLSFIFMRRDGFTNAATYEEIIEMAKNNPGIIYDKEITDIRFDIKDFKKMFEKYKNEIGEELPIKKLTLLDFYDENMFLRNGSILFKDDYDNENTSVTCIQFNGLTKGDDLITSINRYKGNILDTIDYVLEFIFQRMNHSLIKMDNTRKEIDAFPKRAVFEGVINAFAHRDYYINGSQIQIEIYKNRLEISSPGKFYGGTSFKRNYELNGIISKRRNELICNIFSMLKMMEMAGTGFEKVMDSYKNADEKHKPFAYANDYQFTLVLPDLTYKDGVDIENINIEFIPVPNGTKYDEEILIYCLYDSKRASDIAKRIGISNSSYFRNSILDNLTRENYLVSEEVNGIKYYRTNINEIRIK